MSKKLISLFIAAMMLIALVPAAALAKGESVPVKADNTVASWGFESDEGWTFVDGDGDGNNWYRYYSSYSSHSGNYSLCSESSNYSSGSLKPDNWAISPAVKLPDEEGLTLIYYVETYLSSKPEKYQAYIGESTDTAAMTPITEVITLSSINYEMVSVDLTAYAGKTVYVAFRHFGVENNYKMFIDDVQITVGAPELPEEIDTIYIEGVDLPPVAGESAADHVALTVPEDANYSITRVDWYKNGSYSGFTGTFVEGETYYMRIELTPAEGYAFTSDPAVYINGGTEMLDWGYVSGGAYMCYTKEYECIAAELPLLGDINLDGKVDIADVTLAMRGTLGIENLTDEQILAGDVDGDGEVTINDVILIMRYANDIIIKFPTK